MFMPIGGSTGLYFLDLPGAPPPQPEAGPVPFWNSHTTLLHVITPGWLATYGTAVLAGRDIQEGDTHGALPVALVNEAFARKFLPNRNPIGETVRSATGGETRTIVGIVRDAVYISVRDGVRPTVYVPLAQRDSEGLPTTEVNISVRFDRCRIGSMHRSRGSAWSRCSQGSSARWPCCSRLWVSMA
jgi:hypothetical protein